MNKTQKFIAGLLFPFIFIIAAWGISEKISSYPYNTFDLKETWPIWSVTFLLIMIIELFIFRTHKS